MDKHLGGWSDIVSNSILEYIPESETWAEVEGGQTMKATRYGAAVSPVNFENYKTFCKNN